jgi:hypothetical protein
MYKNNNKYSNGSLATIYINDSSNLAAFNNWLDTLSTQKQFTLIRHAIKTMLETEPDAVTELTAMVTEFVTTAMNSKDAQVTEKRIALSDAVNAIGSRKLPAYKIQFIWRVVKEEFPTGVPGSCSNAQRKVYNAFKAYLEKEHAERPEQLAGWAERIGAEKLFKQIMEYREDTDAEHKS